MEGQGMLKLKRGDRSQHYEVQMPEEFSRGSKFAQKDDLRRKICDWEEVKKDCLTMLEKTESILEAKQKLVEKIDSLYSESSNLIKKQRLLMIFASEVENIFKNFLTNERVFYFNNLLKNSASENISRSNIDTILE